MQDDHGSEVERLARGKRTGLVRELAALLAHNKKWWLAPIILAVLLLGALVILGGSGVAPFLYPF